MMIKMEVTLLNGESLFVGGPRTMISTRSSTP